MASWIRGTEESVGAGVFDGEQIESPGGPSHDDYFPPLQDNIDRLLLAHARRGEDPRDLAKQMGVSKSTMYAAISRAQLREEATRRPKDPAVELLFPPINFAPNSPCPHCGAIKEGDEVCCMVCHQTGIEDHPAFDRTASDNEPNSYRLIPNPSGKLGGTEPKQRRGRKPKSAAARKRQRDVA